MQKHTETPSENGRRFVLLINLLHFQIPIVLQVFEFKQLASYRNLNKHCIT